MDAPWAKWLLVLAAVVAALTFVLLAITRSFAVAVIGIAVTGGLLRGYTTTRRPS